jgi:hypothetical protein
MVHTHIYQYIYIYINTCMHASMRVSVGAISRRVVIAARRLTLGSAISDKEEEEGGGMGEGGG